MRAPLFILLFLALTAYGQQTLTSVAVLPSDGTALNSDELEALTDEMRETALKVLPTNIFVLLKQDVVVKRLGGADNFIKECKESTCIVNLGKKYYRGIYYSNQNVYYNLDGKGFLFSVRCLKDQGVVVMAKKKKNEVSIRSSAAEYLTFVASTGNNQQSMEMRYEDENIWLTQKLMAALYGVEIPTINYHIKKIFSDSELSKQATIRKFLIVQTEGERDIYATSLDYDKDAKTTQEFFATVQNKLHYATHKHTAAEIIYTRANAKKQIWA